MAKRIESTFGKQGLIKQSSETFQYVLNSIGIHNEQMINQLNHEALEEYKQADDWVSWNSIAYFMKCADEGVGSPGCS